MKAQCGVVHLQLQHSRFLCVQSYPGLHRKWQDLTKQNGGKRDWLLRVVLGPPHLKLTLIKQNELINVKSQHQGNYSKSLTTPVHHASVSCQYTRIWKISKTRNTQSNTSVSSAIWSYNSGGDHKHNAHHHREARNAKYANFSVVFQPCNTVVNILSYE